MIVWSEHAYWKPVVSRFSAPTANRMIQREWKPGRTAANSGIESAGNQQVR